jgi:hypothetical protein
MGPGEVASRARWQGRGRVEEGWCGHAAALRGEEEDGSRRGSAWDSGRAEADVRVEG